MRNNKNRSGETDGKLVVEINSQILSCLLDCCFVAVMPHIIIFIDSKNSVFAACRVIVTARCQSCRSCIIVVALNKYAIFIADIQRSNGRFERSNACRSLVIAVAVVAAAQEAVRRCKTDRCLHLADNALNECRTRIVTARVLIVRAGDNGCYRALCGCFQACFVDYADNCKR